MPCYRCGVRQTDPVRGPSPWKRGVRGGSQVLVCPDCQRAHDWTGDLDQCAACGSTLLVRILGETHCRACGAMGERAAPGVRAAAAVTAPAVTAPAVTGPAGPPATSGSAGLAGDVEAALDRLFGRARA
jgi:hypothetical protein